MSPRYARAGGQAATETLLLTALVALVLGLTLDGPIAELLDAIAQRYARFTWAVSLP